VLEIHATQYANCQAQPDMRAAALGLIARGFYVLPIYALVWDPTGRRWICSCRHGAKCTAAGKHPAIKRWNETATNDPAVARQYWGGKNASRGIGIACELSALTVTDEDGPEGAACLAALEAGALGPLPRTLSVRSGRVEGGTHRLFSTRHLAPEARPRNSAGEGLDIRGNGGFVVAPPSLHKGGQRYAWLLDAPVAPLPDAWVTWARDRGSQGRKPRQALGSSPREHAAVPLTGLAAAAAGLGETSQRQWSEHDLERFIHAAEHLWAAWLPTLKGSILDTPDGTLDNVHKESQWLPFVWWCQAHDLAYGESIGWELSDAISRKFKSYDPERDEGQVRNYRRDGGVGLAWGYAALKAAKPDWEVQWARQNIAAAGECGALPQGEPEKAVDSTAPGSGKSAHQKSSDEADDVPAQGDGRTRPSRGKGSGCSIVPPAAPALRRNRIAQIRPAGGHIQWPAVTGDDAPRAKKNHRANTAALCRELGLDFARDSFSERTMVQLPAGDWLEWSDVDAWALVAQAANFGYAVSKRELDDYVDSIAAAGLRNLALDYLETLQWDGTPRVNRLCTLGFGTADTAYAAEVGTLLMTAMVRRVKYPGAPFKLVPVLRSEQDWRKTAALAALCGTLNGRALSVEASFDIVASAEKTIEKTQGTLLTIFDEMAGYSRRETDDIKSWISRLYERGRSPWDRRSHDVPRTFICAMTTNRSDYLTDLTGNVRYVELECERMCEPDWITENRAQLLAEAMALEATAPRYLTLSEHAKAIQKKANEAAMETPDGEQLLADAIECALVAAGDDGIKLQRIVPWQVMTQKVEPGTDINNPKLGRRLNALMARAGFTLRQDRKTGRYWVAGAGRMEFRAQTIAPDSGLLLASTGPAQ
jgi:Virulence-associated protein E/Bifunctional DNA primase/polymerase, N-terminal